MLLPTIISILPLCGALPPPSLYKRDATVTLADGTSVTGTSTEGVDSFLGIPYAQPPVGNLRLRPPQRITSPLGTVNATQTAKSCPQFILNLNGSTFLEQAAAYLVNTPFVQREVLDASEDCLTIDVIRPSTATAGDNLPVLFWMFGGAFALGSTSMYDGTPFVSKSIAQGKPIVWVAVNYRVGGFGLMPGKEILADGAANLALLDQRLGLEWVADNIAQFGGDPSKVTIFGESAGSISVFHQMALYGGDNIYNGKPLFRGGIMSSGSVIGYDPVDAPQAQQVYDRVVHAAGCDVAVDDSLACLRSLSYEDFLNAATSVPAIFDYDGVQLSYPPRPDGNVIPNSVDQLLANGQYAKVPFIIGDQRDEGTLFSLVQTNVSTTTDLVTYLNTFFYPSSPRAIVEGLVSTYPDNIIAGSPYNTGIFNNIYGQYKRLASFLGDALFNLQRRRLLSLNSQHSTQPTWSYISTYLYGTPILGTFHGSDLVYAFEILGDGTSNPAQSIHSYFLSFVNTLDPNNGTDSSQFIKWPQWTDSGREIIEIDSNQNTVSTDDFRETSYQYLLANGGQLRT